MGWSATAPFDAATAEIRKAAGTFSLARETEPPPAPLGDWLAKIRLPMLESPPHDVVERALRLVGFLCLA